MRTGRILLVYVFACVQNHTEIWLEGEQVLSVVTSCAVLYQVRSMTPSLHTERAETWTGHGLTPMLPDTNPMVQTQTGRDEVQKR